MPAVYNAANEMAVTFFLEGRIGFVGMGEVVEATMSRHSVGPIEQVGDVVEADREARDSVRELAEGQPSNGGVGNQPHLRELRR